MHFQGVDVVEGGEDPVGGLRDGGPVAQAVEPEVACGPLGGAAGPAVETG